MGLISQTLQREVCQSKMLINRIFYRAKPFIPRRFQIAVRRCVAVPKRRIFQDVWPICPTAGATPRGWTGWPDGKKFAFVLMHDVDTEVGHRKVPDLLKLDRSQGFRSSFHFVPERYSVSAEVRDQVKNESCAVGVHGLRHDGTLFSSRKEFVRQAQSVNRYLKEWECIGFSSPSMHRNLEWTLDFDILCETSTFDTDPFEPQPEGVGTIFPFVVYRSSGEPSSPQSPAPKSQNQEPSTQPPEPSIQNGVACSQNPVPSTLHQKRSFYVELPYTLPQDHCIFVILKETSNRIWREKLDWIADRGGMALLNSHPDYMNFDGDVCGPEEYPVDYYSQFLTFVRDKYGGKYWNALPGEVGQFWLQNMSHHRTGPDLSELKFDDSRPEN
jgi:peptidoglycan/xylan/chitin deacetylase (PgdA/CDA1 family)